MWPWRRHSPFTGLDLPKRCFISHSYQDSNERERLLSLLPSSIDPYIFPPITVNPEDMVSDRLIAAILACDGLIYLNGESSSRSFWVAFERDYALRAGKRVFSFVRGRAELIPDNSPPLELRIFPTWAAGDTSRVRATVDFMRDSRSFLPFDLDTLERKAAYDEDADETLLWAFARLTFDGGYGIFFGSERASKSWWINSDAAGLAGERFKPLVGDRVLIALLDDCDYADSFPWKVRDVVQLYGDAQRSEVQRIDDLIVRLYWLIYRNTRQNQLS